MTEPPPKPLPTPYRATGIAAITQELGRSSNELHVILKSGRLDITANVDRHGVHELIDMLGHYEAVLAKIGSWNEI